VSASQAECRGFEPRLPLHSQLDRVCTGPRLQTCSLRGSVHANVIRPYVASYERHCRTQHLTERTIALYRREVDALAAYLVDDPDAATKLRLTDYFGERLEHMSASTVSISFRSVRAFFRILVVIDILPTSLMERMRGPKVREHVPPAYSDDDLEALFVACSSRSLRDRRDNAMPRAVLSASQTIRSQKRDKAIIDNSQYIHDKGERAYVQRGPRHVSVN
jgi:integrase